MSSSPLKIAIIGGGHIGPRHAASIISNPHTTLIALVEPSPFGPSVAASLSTTHYTTLSSLISSPDKPNAAIICTPNHTHTALCLELIAAGIHVLVEKPISTSIDEGISVIEKAKEKGVKLLVGHHRRFNPYLLSTKASLPSLGEVIAIQGTWCLQKPESYFTTPETNKWRQRSTSGGVILINLVHEVDILQYLFGHITFVSALETKKTRAYDAEEGAAILLRFESGVLGTFILNDNTPSPWNFESGTGENPVIPQVPSSSGSFYRILGTRASLSVPDLARWSYDGVKEREEKGWNCELAREVLEVRMEDVPFDLQVQHLVDVVEGREEASCSGEEGLRALVVCEAVKRAIMKGDGMPIHIKGFKIIEKQLQQGFKD